MITVIAPPGCYGTYITRCLYHYTDIKNQLIEPMTFDQFGSSHVFRPIIPQSKLSFKHLENASWTDERKIVIILADNNHLLDYFDNQYIKQSLANTVEYMTGVWGIEFINEKICQWGYKKPFDETMPTWTLREFVSFCLTDCWKDGYNNDKYFSIAHSYCIKCQDIFNINFYSLLLDIVNKLNLELITSYNDIVSNHKNFLSAQKFHGIQNKCDQFVNATINSDILVSNPCITIFDEAYVQHKLRVLGYEITCDGLNIFPDSSTTLNKIIYKI